MHTKDDLFSAYLAARAKYPGMCAANAYRVARERVAASAPRVEMPEYPGATPAETELTDGLALRIAFKPDDYSDFAERSNLTVEWLSRSERAAISDAPEGWMDRDGNTYWHGERSGDIARITSDCALADAITYNRKAGMSRHVAWLEARRSHARQFDYWLPFWRGENSWAGVVVSLVDEDGDTLAENAVYGYEAADDNLEQAAREMLGEVFAEYRRTCEARQANVRAFIPEARARYHALADELHGLRAQSIAAPTACAVVRDTLASIRREVATAVVTIETLNDHLRALARWS